MGIVQRGSFLYFILRMLAGAVTLLLVLPIHEYAHGLVAYKLGDDTAKVQGRLTLNPLAHLDLVGSVCILLFGFGWATPVPVNPRNFKNPKAGMAITAFAGPLSNFVAAFLGCLIFAAVDLFLKLNSGVVETLTIFLTDYIIINVGIAIFNLLPFPPLDGFNMISAFLSDETIYKIKCNGRIINVVVLLLFVSGILGKIIGPITFQLANGMLRFAMSLFGEL